MLRANAGLEPHIACQGLKLKRRIVCQAPAKRGRKKKTDDEAAEEDAQPEKGAAGRVKLNGSVAGEP